MMKRFSLLSAGLIVTALALGPGPAAAKLVELGRTSPIAAPACPKGVAAANCNIVLTRTTALQSISDGVGYPTKVKQNGWLVSFTVGLSQLSSRASTDRNLLHGLDQRFGGTPQLIISVLRPGPRNQFSVVAQSATFHLIPFLGQVLQQPLSLPPSFTQFTALPVKAGDVIALTIPTWAPVLSYNLSASKFAYRQSRMANCTHIPGSQTAQLAVGTKTRYLCNYTGTRVEYSASEVVNTPYPRKFVH